MPFSQPSNQLLASRVRLGNGHAHAGDCAPTANPCCQTAESTAGMFSSLTIATGYEAWHRHDSENSTTVGSSFVMGTEPAAGGAPSASRLVPRQQRCGISDCAGGAVP